MRALKDRQPRGTLLDEDHRQSAKLITNLQRHAGVPIPRHPPPSPLDAEATLHTAVPSIVFCSLAACSRS